ncbi:hybrid sensor histidine kinase/response regulator transcription factor [Wenyingzhuangia sp. IMCC45467]
MNISFLSQNNICLLKYRHIILTIILLCSISKTTYAQGLFFERVLGQHNNPVTAIHGIAKDSIGYLWFGSKNGVYRYDGNTYDYYYHNKKDTTSLPNSSIRNVVFDKKQGLWFLTYDFKYVNYNYDLENFTQHPKDSVDESIKTKLKSYSTELNQHKIINGKKYILTRSNQFMSKDVKTGEVTLFNADISIPGSLTDDHITSFYIDNDDVLWLGADSGEVYKANVNHGAFKFHYSYLSKNGVSKLLKIKAFLQVDDELWLGTMNNGVLIYKNQQLVKEHPFYKSNTRLTKIRSLYKDRHGGIWIGGVDGLEHYNQKTNKITSVVDENKHPNIVVYSVYTITEYNETKLFVGVYNGLVIVDMLTLKSTYKRYRSEINNERVMDLLVDSKNNVWLATNGSGLLRLRFNNDYETVIKERFTISSDLDKHKVSSDLVNAVIEDDNGLIWVGTSEGLDKIFIEDDEVHIQKVPLTPLSLDNNIVSIEKDAKNNIWIARKGMITMLENKTEKVLNYKKEDQLGAWMFLGQSIYKDHETNNIYLGAKNGYLHFNPNEVKNDKYKKSFILKSLYLSGKKIKPLDVVNKHVVLHKSLSQTNELVLDPESRNFTIELAMFNYSNATSKIFEYQLEGYDDTWSTTTNPKITYRKVPAGTYQFRIRQLVPNETYVSTVALPITIKEYWYFTWWAKSFYFALFIVVVYWVFTEILYRDRLKNQIEQEKINAEQQKELNKKKMEFFTGISHDLKTPLTLIVDPLQRLQSKTISEEDKKTYFEIVNRNITYLKDLIHQILDFKKPGSGLLTLNNTSKDFSSFVKECYKKYKFIADKRNIELELTIDKSLSYCILDYEKTEQVLMNILSNAFKYTPDRGQVSIDVFVNKNNSFIEIQIKDNGIGIEEKTLENIFEPFNNIDASPFYGYSTGIGLSLTKNLVSFLEGEIKIKSNVNKGTVVFISLPYRATQQEITEKLVNSKELDSDIEGDKSSLASKNITILIVEDNPDIQKYLNLELQKDYEILQEYDGKNGLKTAIDKIPDLIISDIMMPEMEGTELCKTLKENENTSHIPVVMLTAKGANESKVEGYQLGAEAYINKPFSIEVLRAQLKSILRNREILQKKLSGLKKVKDIEQEISGLDNKFVNKAYEIIISNISHSDFNADVLAAELNISQRQLYRKLKAVCGNTVHEFITKVKMEEAEKMLKEVDFTVSEIAYKLGFSEPSNFSRTFSKYAGCSPSQFRKQID